MAPDLFRIVDRTNFFDGFGLVYVPNASRTKGTGLVPGDMVVEQDGKLEPPAKTNWFDSVLSAG